MFELVEAVTRLNIDTLNQVIRRKVEEGNYSRAPADLCALLYFFSSQHKLTKSQRDVDLFITVVRDLRHMQTTGLQMEQIDLIVRALAHSCEPEFREQLMLHRIDEHSSAHDLYCREVEAFLPKLVDQSSKELLRCTLDDIITLMNSFLKLWDKQIFSKEFSLKAILSNCDAYLSEYLGKSKKDITGGQFADMVHLISRSHSEGLHTFEQKIVHRLQHIFLNDNAELYVFSMGDILKLYRGFESLNDYFNKDKVIEGIVEIVLESRFYEDEALLELLLEFKKTGLIEKY
jgi:hypothetical protein